MGEGLIKEGKTAQLGFSVKRPKALLKTYEENNKKDGQAGNDFRKKNKDH